MKAIRTILLSRKKRQIIVGRKPKQASIFALALQSYLFYDFSRNFSKKNCNYLPLTEFFTTEVQRTQSLIKH
jgi:hypothetical protein